MRIEEARQMAGFVENWIDLAAVDEGEMSFQQTRKAILHAQRDIRRLRDILEED
jgi:hypothetical protein